MCTISVKVLIVSCVIENYSVSFAQSQVHVINTPSADLFYLVAFNSGVCKR